MYQGGSKLFNSPDAIRVTGVHRQMDTYEAGGGGGALSVFLPFDKKNFIGMNV